MGQATILRKMTLKSVFHSGVMQGLTVQQVIDQLRNTYLRWIYYNYSGITFTDDILDIINIRPEDRITKPGKNPEYGEQLQKIIHSRISKTSQEKNIRIASSRARARLKKMNKDLRNTKGAMQAKNHGH